ncbi:mucin-5AC-like isoform X2 [Acanthaster planci]|uniref:Mucin-5AC-like isoform X2 n=1 Tax=Acanthaster planci TaxID=133434 RepID=A0A8B7YKB9_ACAPL|nr:mucin-5AC-like isoform X2 [Acanthaster planci]
MQKARFKELFRTRRTHRRESSEGAYSGITRVPGNSGTELVVTSVPSNAEPKLSSQDNETPDINANEADMPDQATNQESVLSDVGRYRRSRMKRTSKVRRSASTSSADNSSRASLSTCSGSSGSSDRSCISLDSVEVKSLRAIAFAKNPSSLPRSRSETRFGPKARTRLYKRSLRHQSSDSVVVIGGMHQENKILLGPSDATMSTTSSIEQVATPKPKTGPHPKKKMLRSHSESAIDVTMLRTAKNNLQDSTSNVTPKSGIVCSNEDLMKILSDARKQKVTRRRNNTIVCRLDATPELPQEHASTGEAETCLNEAIAEVAPLPKRSLALPVNSSPRSWATRHHSMRITNNHTAEDLNTRAMDLHDWSPKHALINSNQTSNANANFPAKIFSRSEKRNSNGFCRNRSYPTTNAQCPTELEPMLGEVESDQDDNGNIVDTERVNESAPVIKKHSPVKSTPSPVITPEVENKPSTSTSTAPKTITCTGFDPELLGQAIERHLAIAKVSPTHENKPERSRSGSIKSMWTQNRISNLVTRFPFRRENSTTAAV